MLVESTLDPDFYSFMISVNLRADSLITDLSCLYTRIKGGELICQV